MIANNIIYICMNCYSNENIVLCLIRYSRIYSQYCSIESSIHKFYWLIL